MKVCTKEGRKEGRNTKKHRIEERRKKNGIEKLFTKTYDCSLPS